MTTFSGADEIHVAGMSVLIDGDSRKMDDLHRTHIARLRAELAQDLELFESWAADMAGMRSLKDAWKLFAFAGWFVAFLFMVRDLIGGKA
jgi:hypothetical protein